MMFGSRDDDYNDVGPSSFRIWRQIHLNDESFLDVFTDYDADHLYLRLVNKSTETIGSFAFAMNSNAIGLMIVQPPQFPGALEFGDVVEVSVPVRCDPAQVANVDKVELQIALRTSLGNLFALARIPVEYALTEAGNIGPDRFRDLFTSLGDGVSITVEDATLAGETQLLERNIFTVGKNHGRIYVSFALPSGAVFVAEIEQKDRDIIALIKGTDPSFCPLVHQSVQNLFAQK
jgi:hypothetical protein